MIDATYQRYPDNFDMEFKLNFTRGFCAKSESAAWRQQPKEAQSTTTFGQTTNDTKSASILANQMRGSVRALEEQYYTKSKSNYNSKDMDHHNNSSVAKRKGFTKRSALSPSAEFVKRSPASIDVNPGIEFTKKLSVDRDHRQHNPVIKTTVQNLDLECVCPQRAGIIIYTTVGESTYIGLGLDSRTHDLTDFGGGVIYKTDVNVVRGALREFDEETLSIFETIAHDSIKHCPVIYDNNNLIIFVRINTHPDVVSKIFNEQYNRIIEMRKCSSPRKHRDPEVCGITWLTWEEFQHSIKEKGIMFTRVQRFLAKADDFSYLL